MGQIIEFPDIKELKEKIRLLRGSWRIFSREGSICWAWSAKISKGIILSSSAV